MSSDEPPSAKKQKTERDALVDEIIDKAVKEAASRMGGVDEKEITSRMGGVAEKEIEKLVLKWLPVVGEDRVVELVVDFLEPTAKLAAENKGLTAENKGLTAENVGLKEQMFGHHIESDGLKPLCDMTISSAHLKTKHEPSELVVEENHIKCAEIDWNKVGERTNFSRDEDVEISSEGDVLVRVYNLVYAVMKSLGLDRILAVYCNVTVMGVEGDLVICWKQNKLPIGSFEIKKPKANLSQKNNQVIGQVFDQMHTYRIGGPSQVFSVLTTGNEWQLHSTDSLEKVKDVDLQQLLREHGGTASRTVPSSLPAGQSDVSPEALFTFTGHQDIEIKSMDGGGEKKRGASVRQITEGEQCLERKQYGSGIVSLDKKQHGGGNQSKSVANLVATALLLMVNSTKNWSTPRIANKPLHGPVRIIHLGKEKQAFSFSSGKLEEGISFDQPVGEQQKNLRIWFPLGRGAFATCCLATGEDNGKCCVIKFYHVKDCFEVAEKEKDFWVSINGKDCSKLVRAHRFRDDGRCLLIMPYIHPIPAEERRNLLNEDPVQGRLGSALRKMARTGLFYEKDDIRWHHIGYRASDKQEIRLCDFGNLVTIDKEMQDEELIKNALHQLQKRLQQAKNSGIIENHLA